MGSRNQAAGWFWLGLSLGGALGLTLGLLKAPAQAERTWRTLVARPGGGARSPGVVSGPDGAPEAAPVPDA